MATLSDLSKLRGILSRAKNVVVLTGAGISAESGIPTFRGSGGFWRTYRSQDLATPGAFKRSPSLVWEFYHYRREVVFTKSPNQAHRALADAEGKLAAAGRKLTVITQNIDGLHQAAGSKNVVELHGSLFKTQCTKCRHVEVNRDSPICEALQGRGTSMEALLLVTDPGSPKQSEPILPTTDTENSNQQQPLMSVSSAEPQKTESPVGGPPPTPGQPSSPGSTGGGAPTGDDGGNKSLTNRQKLKLFMRDYGSTVIVFHITHSLALLGLIYVAFSAGLDMAWVVKNLGLEGKSLDVAAGASTFVIAYAVNKVLAPLRFAITFAVTPFIVRYLRRVGVLKTPK